MTYKDFKELAKKIETEGECLGSSSFGETYRLGKITYMVADGGYCQRIVDATGEKRKVYELQVRPDGSTAIVGSW